MAKDKKKKKDKKSTTGGKAAKTLKSLSQNPMVADVVAAALVATASALKDSNKARRLAANVSDELEGLARDATRQGNAMWKLALDIGRKALDEISGDTKAAKPTRAAKPAKAAKPPKAARSAKPAKAAKPSKAAKKAKR